MQSELENLSFMYTNAEDYAKVKRRVVDLYKEHEKELAEVRFLLCLQQRWVEVKSYLYHKLFDMSIMSTVNIFFLNVKVFSL